MIYFEANFYEMELPKKAQVILVDMKRELSNKLLQIRLKYPDANIHLKLELKHEQGTEYSVTLTQYYADDKTVNAHLPQIPLEERRIFLQLPLSVSLKHLLRS